MTRVAGRDLVGVLAAAPEAHIATPAVLAIRHLSAHRKVTMVALLRVEVIEDMPVVAEQVPPVAMAVHKGLLAAPGRLLLFLAHQ
jgi:hypothetical protein